MVRLLVAVLAVLVVPGVGAGQVDEEEGGTFSTYSADEARLDPSDFPPPPEPEPKRVRSPQDELFERFHNELAEWGRWEKHAAHGWIWRPTVMAFRPFANGWWTSTDQGWSFESDEPYAWAVYHYGRWAWVDGGWAWVPGFEWSPARVVFRMSEGYVGWAPLGPDGLAYDWMPAGWTTSPWVFVPAPYFGQRFPVAAFLDHARCQAAFHASVSVSGRFHHGGWGDRSPGVGAPGPHVGDHHRPHERLHADRPQADGPHGARPAEPRPPSLAPRKASGATALPGFTVRTPPGESAPTGQPPKKKGR